MPSHLHEGLLDLFRTDLLLAPSLLAEEFRIPLPGLSQMRAEPCDFTDVGPKEFRGDLALSTHDDRDLPVLGVCVEVQLSKADARRWKWPVYLTTLRSRLCCPVVLLVVTPSRAVAKWAEQPIELDTVGSVIQPLVLGPDRFPVVTDPTEAGRCPERATLSAIAHGAGPHTEEVLAAFLAGLMKTDDEHAKMYLDLVDDALSRARGAHRSDCPWARAVGRATGAARRVYRYRPARRLADAGSYRHWHRRTLRLTHNQPLRPRRF
ncbi:hypothetical protein AB0M13_26845 [Nocardia fluminea]|uniref:hypothetical protein n=1 Tax=Nocardia fluminea TaxID=134984 RepID=UPI003422C304